MDPINVTEHLTYSTVRIEAILNEQEYRTGTGYFFRFCERTQDDYIPAIVTNKHVLKSAIKIRIWLHLRAPDRKVLPESVELIVGDIQKYCFLHPDPTIDLAIIFVLPIIENLKLGGNKVYFSGIPANFIPTESEYEDYIAIDDILMVGYPNGIWDSKNNMPIARRGITATNPSINYEGRPEFLIDAACFPGSSGSPVFLYNLGNHVSRINGIIHGEGRIKLLGTLYAGPQQTIQGEIKIIDVPQSLVPIPEINIPYNLGFVIKSNQLLVFNEILLNYLKLANLR
jgi:hypothetical protein